MSAPYHIMQNGKFPMQDGNPVLITETRHKELCCNWQAWQRFKAVGQCDEGAWSNKDWVPDMSGKLDNGVCEPAGQDTPDCIYGDATQPTMPDGGNDWGWVYVPLCGSYHTEPGTITGGAAVQCDPENEESLAYEVGTEIVVWGPVHAHTVDKTMENLGITTPSTEEVPITGQLKYPVAEQYLQASVIESSWDDPDVDSWYIDTSFLMWDCVEGVNLCTVIEETDLGNVKTGCYTVNDIEDGQVIYEDSVWWSLGVALLSPICPTDHLPSGSSDNPEADWGVIEK